jgi:hypothetical protein
MVHAELAEGNFFPDEVNVQLDVLGSPVMDRVPGHVDRRDVVAVDYGSLPDAMVQLVEKMAQPGAFCDGVGDPPVLGLGT